jgi:predicted acyl esterase
MSRLGRVLVVPLVLALASLGACSSGSDGAAAANTATTAAKGPKLDLSRAGAAAFEAHGSVGQVWLIGATAGERLRLVGANGRVVQRGDADAQGSLIFRDVGPGKGYRVAAGRGATLSASPRLTVTTPGDAPSFASYQRQQIEPGYGYLRTRDGTLLSINVKLPGPPEDGPYPTVIEYSGYSPADPDSPQPSELIAGLLGYATVGVNIRGTGCSGGAFQFFEPLQSTDGYDVVETIAAQPWAAFHKVGMVGISYPGISQLFVAQMQPPHLAAIAPLSVIADTARGTLAPGGIFNNGFALSWAKDRQHDAQAAPASGQGWAGKRINNGDTTCAANQKLRSQTPDILQMIEANKYWTDEIAAPLAPELFVHKIKVPTFLAGSWQDEQTGGYFANLFDDFTGSKHVYFTGTNGNHTDPLSPWIFQRWYEFLSIYVAREVPSLPPAAPLLLSGIGSSVFGTGDLQLPPDRFAGITDYDQAKKRYEHDPRVRVLLDNGAGAAPGVPTPASELDFSRWPVEGTRATRYYFDANGALLPGEAGGEGTNDYRYDPSVSQLTTIDGSDSVLWGTLPPWNWRAPAAGTALSYETEPLKGTVTMVGNGSVDLWLKSTARDTDVQVTVSEVRPDGKETYVGAGWLRASDRALAKNATELRPVHPFTKAAVKPLPKDKYVEARVELFPFAHVFRAGSRVRIIVGTPGASRPRWKFDVLPADGTVTNSIAFGGAHASRVVLPVITGIDEPTTPLPPCPALRGQPCRTAAVIDNGN